MSKIGLLEEFRSQEAEFRIVLSSDFCLLSSDYFFMVGLGRLELPTSPLSGVRSNQLSYRPAGLGKANFHPLSPQNKGYKFYPVASIWFCSTVPAIKLAKICYDLSKLDRRKANQTNQRILRASVQPSVSPKRRYQVAVPLERR